MVDIEELQRQLTEQIAALDKQRKEQAAQFNKEAAERATLAEMERKQQIAAYEEAERKRAVKKAAEVAAEEVRVQEAKKAQIAAENTAAAAEEARRLYEEKLAWLEAEINKQEFVEEQHNKAMGVVTIPYVASSPTNIDVEHPVAPDNLGNAVQGTDGDTPETPLMSDHLKGILRQAQRSY